MAEHKRRHGHPLQPRMFSSCDALLMEPSIHGRESGIAPVQRLYHFKHLQTQVFCATYISRLQVLRRWGSGEATGGDAVDGSSLMRSLYKESTNEAPSWNVRTLLDRDSTARPERTELSAKELARYRIDIAALSETRLADEGILK